MYSTSLMWVGLKTDSHDRIGDEHSTAAGTTIMELTLNLSLILQFGLRSNNRRIGDEREVVAEISATYDDGGHHAYVSIHRVGSPAAIGTRATTVPTLVPIDTEIEQAARKSPGRIMLAGRMLSARLTVASTAPIALADAANEPAST